MDKDPVEKVLEDFLQWLTDNKVEPYAHGVYTQLGVNGDNLYSTEQLVKKFLEQTN